MKTIKPPKSQDFPAHLPKFAAMAPFCLPRHARMNRQNSRNHFLVQSRYPIPPSIKLGPVRGPDLEALRLEQGLLVGEANFSFGFRTVGDYNKIIRNSEPVSHQVEFLFRLYSDEPGVPPLTNFLQMAELFDRFFPDARNDANRRSVCMSRFGGIFGSSKPAVHRWLDHSGEVNPQLRRIVSKLLTFNAPKARAEAVAAQIYAARGTDFELTFPRPPADGPVPPRRGRRPTLPSARRGKPVDAS